MTPSLTRREFVVAAGALVGAACASRGPSAAAASARAGRLPAGATVLFQGDSITDAGRNRRVAEPNAGGALGAGYPLLVASALLAAHPDRALRFFNRGISGNKVPDLQARWQEDAVALRPDVLSILIGVNDIWHKLNGNYAGTVADYETGYAALLDQTRRALPSTRILVLEPFVLRTGAVNERWFPEFDERRAVARRVAERAGVTFVPLQAPLDEAARRTGPAYWAADGVHPTPAGHGLIAERWRAAVGV